MTDPAADNTIDPTPAPAAAVPAEPTPAPAPAAKRAKPSKKPAHRVGSHRSRSKEVFYVAVAHKDADGKTETVFCPATDFIGKKMPFDKPKQTCAVRVYPDVLCLTTRTISKARAKIVREQPIEIPQGQLARIARRAGELGELTVGQLIIEHGDTLHRATISVEDGGTARLEGVDDSAGELYELSPAGEKISLYFYSPVIKRKVAVSFNGFLEKPGNPETLLRAAAKIIRSSLGVDEFALAAGFNAVNIPGLPSGAMRRTGARDSVSFELPVSVFTEQFEMVTSGKVTVEIDLLHALATKRRLFFKVIPGPDLVDVLVGTYPAMLDRYIDLMLPEAIGARLEDITVEIALGQVTGELVAELKALTANIRGVDITPMQMKAKDITPVDDSAPTATPAPARPVQSPPAAPAAPQAPVQAPPAAPVQPQGPAQPARPTVAPPAPPAGTPVRPPAAPAAPPAGPVPPQGPVGPPPAAPPGFNPFAQ